MLKGWDKPFSRTVVQNRPVVSFVILKSCNPQQSFLSLFEAWEVSDSFFYVCKQLFWSHLLALDHIEEIFFFKEAFVNEGVLTLLKLLANGFPERQIPICVSRLDSIHPYRAVWQIPIAQVRVREAWIPQKLSFLLLAFVISIHLHDTRFFVSFIFRPFDLNSNDLRVSERVLLPWLHNCLWSFFFPCLDPL